MKLGSIAARQRVVFFIAAPRQADMIDAARLLEAGAIRPVVERTYPLTDVAAAMEYSLTGHARAKLVLTVP